MQSLEELKNTIFSELPKFIETDLEVRNFILNITSQIYADKKETDNRIEQLLEELKRDREAQERKWEEHYKAQEKKWEENQKVINKMLESIEAQNKKHNASIGALGARWGLNSEAAFRKGLRSILEKSFGVHVQRYEDFDYEGQVFGRPDQIELDVLIYNGTLILCEIKSSVDKSAMYTFWRKKCFYEQKHNRKATRSMVISPMIDAPAQKVAQDLNIETYSYADEVEMD